MSDNGKITNGRAATPPDDPQRYMQRHEDSLLHILIERNFERAKEIIRRIAESERRKAA
jgi:hypothetical protein